MRFRILSLLAVTLLLLVTASTGLGQFTTGSIAGSVVDPSGSVVAQATVTAKNIETGAESIAKTSENGTFNIPQLPRGVYRVTVQAKSGFKKAEITSVKVDVGNPTTVNVTLELGTPQETVTIVGGGEVLQTQTPNIGSTITGRQITELPFTSRDALDLVLTLPGTQTPARPRSSTINGLPRGSLTITLDGLPDQAEDSKSNDGFFTFVRPRIDAIEEVSLSSAVPGAESSGDGAVQIKFSTRGGSSEYHGSGYWYHRNTALNANYYFNNISGQPRQAMILNQYGLRFGGPITIPKLLKSREKAFFFFNYEEFRLPGSTARQRNVLTPDAQNGIFRYGSGATAVSKDLYALAAGVAAAGRDCDPTTPGNQNCTTTADPIVGAMLGKIRSSLTQGGLQALGDNQQRFTWNSPANNLRKFSTVRFDVNLTKKHHLENVWNYNVFISTPDQLNSRDSIFPGIPIGIGGQYSDRFSDSLALRSTIKNNLVNELRVGIGAGGTVLFFPETNPAPFAELGNFNPSFTVFAPGGNTTTSPASGSSSSRNNAPAKVLLDNLSYVTGNHSFNFGTDIASYNSYSFSIARVVPAITFGLNANDPANAAMFISSNFPGASGTDITNAGNLYALLTGRVTTITASAFTSETTGKYTYLGDFTQRVRQRTAGFYAQDAWRFRPNLTINAGVRWELQFPFTAQNSNYTQPVGGYAGVWGVSGVNNLFKPGTLTGTPTAFERFPQGTRAYNMDWNNFGPSVGLAWSPNSTGFLKKLMGESGQTVIRAGFSVAFVREGSDVMNLVVGGNPGGTLTANRSVALGNLTAGSLFRNPAALGPPTIPISPTFPLTAAGGYSPADSVNFFNPDIKTGYAKSWSVGVQRELSRDTVLELRYVGTRGTDLWHQYNLNETNITENGFLNEFKLAQANYQAHKATGTCGGTGQPACSYAYRGPGTNTFPLPIILAHFRGTTAANAGVVANYTGSIIGPSGGTINVGSLFTNATFAGFLAANNANARSFAANLFADADRRALAILAGLPSNIFLTNPNVPGTGGTSGAFVVDNSGSTAYDALQIEVRRRMSRGLLIQASYTFSKSLSNMYGTSGSVFYTPATLRNRSLDNNLSPFDLTHGFKANWIWELPVGRGQWLFGNANGFVDRLAGGWAVHGQARLQSGSTFSFGNVQLVGMTKDELQKAIKIRKTTDATGRGVVFFLPEDIITNTRRANNVSVTSATGFSDQGVPTGRYIAPANSNGCIQEYVGQCGFSNLILHGPSLSRFDISVVKKTKVSERVNVEMRAEFLNAFNNINFKIGSQTAADTSVTNFSAATFGQTAAAYQDLSTTNDVGGRMVQLVLRINF
jgi:Carboxypeptidase regulatory-like domain